MWIVHHPHESEEVHDRCDVPADRDSHILAGDPITAHCGYDPEQADQHADGKDQRNDDYCRLEPVWHSAEKAIHVPLRLISERVTSMNIIHQYGHICQG